MEEGGYFDQRNRVLRSQGSEAGLTLAELLMAIVLLGVAASAVHRLMTTGGRFFREHSSRIEVAYNLRTAVSILASEVRELDSGGGDLCEIGAQSLTYRAMRSTGFVCRNPGAAAEQVVISTEPVLGLRPVEEGRDSVLIFSEGHLATIWDDRWLTAAVDLVEPGQVCPSGSEGLRLRLSGLDSAKLDGVRAGAPVRAFQVTRVRSYQDASGVTWLGLSEWRQSSGWSVTQPIVGPLAPRGLTISYFDPSGAPTSDPSRVAIVRFGITMAGSLRSLPARSGGVRDSLIAIVSLRNRRRPVPEGH